MLRRLIAYVARWRVRQLERDAAVLCYAAAIATMHNHADKAREFREVAQLELQRARWWRRFFR